MHPRKLFFLVLVIDSPTAGMAVFSYRTVREPGQGIYKEKGSKFLAFAWPVTSEADIRERLGAVRKEYFDARHHCYAWMLGADKNQFRASDDGEPNHSAGDPILGQIKAHGVTDVLVVVVRYFGGTKLGVGGLIHAYKTAADAALRSAMVEEKEVTTSVTITYAYAATPEVMQLVKEFNLVIGEQDFEEQCVMKALLSRRTRDAFESKIALLQALGVQVTAVYK